MGGTSSPRLDLGSIQKADDGLYFGRVKSPKTYDNWEYGYFTQEQLEEAGAYRTDTEIQNDEPLYPDGGTKDIAAVYETELEALLEEGDPEFET